MYYNKSIALVKLANKLFSMKNTNLFFKIIKNFRLLEDSGHIRNTAQVKLKGLK